jgi:uroporphyrinogen-III synthase
VAHEAKAVMPYIKRHFPAISRVFYLSGTDVTLDIAAQLRAEGYDAGRAVVYNAIAASRFSDALLARFHDGKIRSVMFFSARTAEIYADLVHRHDLLKCQAGITAFCLSAAIAQHVRTIALHKIEWPEKTDTQALIDHVISSGP